MTFRSRACALLFWLAACNCLARSFDVISTNTGGVEIVIAPIHNGSLMLQFRGQAIYIDPDNKGDYSGLPEADLIFFTAGQSGNYSAIRKASTVVVSAPLSEKRLFGEISAEPAGKGLILSMSGRRFYISGEAPPASIDRVDAAFVCMSRRCVPDAAVAVRNIAARIIFPYRTGGANLRGLKSTPESEIRLRRWD